LKYSHNLGTGNEMKLVAGLPEQTFSGGTKE
jgi:hypothetical protein